MIKCFLLLEKCNHNFIFINRIFSHIHYFFIIISLSIIGSRHTKNVKSNLAESPRRRWWVVQHQFSILIAAVNVMIIPSLQGSINYITAYHKVVQYQFIPCNCIVDLIEVSKLEALFQQKMTSSCQIVDNFYTKNRYDFCHNLFLNNISCCMLQ